MSTEKVVTITREELFQSSVDQTLAHQKALARQAAPPAVEESVTPLRRFLFSSLFYTPLAGSLGGLTTWMLLEPLLDERDNRGDIPLAGFIVFPLLSALVVLFIYLSEGVASRKLVANIGRWAAGVGLTLLFTILAFIPAGWILSATFLLPNLPTTEQAARHVTAWDPSFFVGHIILRSCAWAVLGAALGMGMNMVRSTSAQLRASVMGGTVGGALGGMLFDPINRFLLPATETGALMRFVGLTLVGASVGLFVAFAERLGRDGWVRVRTGPLAGKAFILYRNPTFIGSSPQSDIYLFKDLGIDATHAALHRIGGHYEVEALAKDKYTLVNGRPTGRHRLVSGDQITVGDTIMDFEERLKRRAVSDGPIKEK